ncbi:MAG: holo-ACP synthase [Candidatus Bipolaricaulia bacterium]
MGHQADPARVRVGLDLVEVDRLRHLIEKWGERFLGRVFTPGELGTCLPRRRAEEHLAARFAAKEALVKAMGLRPSWQEIEVMNHPSGEPYFSKLPRGLDPARVRLSLSLAHSSGLAVAVVVVLLLDSSPTDRAGLVPF